MRLGVLENELDDRCRVLQGMWMVANTRLADHINTTAQLAISPRQHIRVFIDRHDLVNLAYHVKQRHVGLCQRLELIDRIGAIFELLFPILRRELSLSFATN